MHHGSTPTSQPEPARVQIGPIGIDQPDLDEVCRRVETMVGDGGRHIICFCESNLFVQASRDAGLRRILERASLVLPDGIFVMHLAQALGRPLPERLPGPSMMLELCEHGLARGWRHFFYGGAPGVPERLAENLARRYPGLQVAGAWSPPFRPLTSEEEREVKAMIEGAAPDLLWVGLGAPKQEEWMAAHQDALAVPVMLGVGAAFDFHTGAVPWAPRWVRQLGLEWAFRMLTGGRRVFWRNVGCVSAALGVLARELSRRWLRRAERP